MSLTCPAILDPLNDQYDISSTKARHIHRSLLEKCTVPGTPNHVVIPVPKRKIHYVQCSVLDSKKNPSRQTLDVHLRNLNQFIDVKCRGNKNLRECLIQKLAKSKRFRPDLQKSLQIQKTLTPLQSAAHYVNSGSSLRRFSAENAKMHRKTGVRIYSSEAVIRSILQKEKMTTSESSMELMGISEREQKYHGGKTEISVGVWRVNPFELITRTLYDELNRKEITVSFPKRMEVDTLIVTAGMDKADHGSAHSLLLCTREKANNSSKRRRPLAYMERPAIENTNNIFKLLGPLRENISLLKDNSCVLIMENIENKNKNCIILHCDENWKHSLDYQWAQQNKAPVLYSQILFISVLRFIGDEHLRFR